MENQSVLDSDEFNDFLTGYRAAATWCGIMDDESGAYDTSDLSDAAVIQSQVDCADFYEANLTLMEETGQKDFSQHGHDFFLTRNRHGAGFWDRGYGMVGEKLSEAARVYGSADLYVGDDERLHFT